MEQATMSLLNNAKGAVHYHTMTGRLNWAIALGQHDVQHVVSALSQCSSHNETSSDDIHVLPKTTTAMAQSNGKVCQLMQLLQLAQKTFSEMIASVDKGTSATIVADCAAIYRATLIVPSCSHSPAACKSPSTVPPAGKAPASPKLPPVATPAHFPLAHEEPPACSVLGLQPQQQKARQGVTMDM
jgi:hypothetical protein